MFLRVKDLTVREEYRMEKLAEKNNILLVKWATERDSRGKVATEPVLYRRGAEGAGLRYGALLALFSRRL